MTKPPVRLPFHVREKQLEKRGRVLTWKRIEAVPIARAKNPAYDPVPDYEFDDLWRAVMSLKSTRFSATTQAGPLAQYSHMAYGWEPRAGVASVHKSGAAPARGPRHKPRPVPPAPKEHEETIVVPSPVCEVPRALVPPRAEAGGTATLPQGREAKLLEDTRHFAAAAANHVSEKRIRVATQHTRF
jgi:hypothetical protein